LPGAAHVYFYDEKDHRMIDIWYYSGIRYEDGKGPLIPACLSCTIAQG